MRSPSWKTNHLFSISSGDGAEQRARAARSSSVCSNARGRSGGRARSSSRGGGRRAAAGSGTGVPGRAVKGLVVVQPEADVGDVDSCRGVERRRPRRGSRGRPAAPSAGSDADDHGAQQRPQILDALVGPPQVSCGGFLSWAPWRLTKHDWKTSARGSRPSARAGSWSTRARPRGCATTRSAAAACSRAASACSPERPDAEPQYFTRDRLHAGGARARQADGHVPRRVHAGGLPRPRRRRACCSSRSRSGRCGRGTSSTARPARATRSSAPATARA